MAELSPILLAQLKRRRVFVLCALAIMMCGAVAKAYQIQVVDKDVYLKEAKSIQQRIKTIDAQRGNILDRNGRILAVSAPVASIWINPVKTLEFEQAWLNLTQKLKVNKERVLSQLGRLPEADAKRVFVLKSNASLGEAEYALGLNLDYVGIQYAKIDGKQYESAVTQRIDSIHKLLSDGQSQVRITLDVVITKPSKFLQALKEETEGFTVLADTLGMHRRALKRDVLKWKSKGVRHRYLKRQLPPEVGQAIRALKLQGIGVEREFKRFYPSGEVAGHLVGFTEKFTHKGQIGLEASFNDWLEGTAGKKRVVVGSSGNVVGGVEWVEKPQTGKDLNLSLDLRLQYITHHALKTAIQERKAKAGSAVILNVKTGEVLALTNQPSFNPNDRSNLKSDWYKNRALTDVFEPGSTMKPFTIASALDMGTFNTRSVVNTHPGRFKVGGGTVKDIRDYGKLDLAGVIKHSSNVGAAKIILSLTPEQQWDMLERFGFGQSTESGFPRETSGIMRPYYAWSEFERATMSFGYALSVSTLQLAHAYSALANDGLKVPISFIKGGSQQAAVRVVSKRNAQKVRNMMRAVVSDEGTAPAARIDGYTIAGKTGTVHKNSRAGGYEESTYVSLFAGIAPAKNPELVMIVMIDEPKGEYFGGRVAAPVFAQVMKQALRLMNIAPDDLPNKKIIHAHSTRISTARSE